MGNGKGKKEKEGGKVNGEEGSREGGKEERRRKDKCERPERGTGGKG